MHAVVFVLRARRPRPRLDLDLDVVSARAGRPTAVACQLADPARASTPRQRSPLLALRPHGARVSRACSLHAEARDTFSSSTIHLTGQGAPGSPSQSQTASRATFDNVRRTVSVPVSATS